MAVLDILFVMRPTWFFPVWIMVVAGISAASSVENPEIYWIKEINWLVFYLILGITLISGGLFASHSIKNEEEYSRKQESFIFQGNRFNDESVKRLTKIILIIGMIILFVLAIYLSLLSDKWNPLLMILWSSMVIVIWGPYHGGKVFSPFAKPVISTIAHGFVGFFLFLVGWNYLSQNMTQGLIDSIPYVLAFMAVSLIIPLSQERKRETDSQSNQNNIRITMAIAVGLVSISALTGYFFGDPVISTAAIVSLPFFVVALVFPKLEHIIRAVRYPILVLAIFLCVRYPWFFVALFITFYIAKWYYYFRFNIDYPSFHVSRD